MSTEPFMEYEILAFLRQEFPPSRPDCDWTKDGGKYITWSEWTSWPTGINGTELGCARIAGWWTFGWAGLFGRAPTLLEAIADFRTRVATEATAVGAVKVNPTSGYNYLEAAIFAAFFQYAYTNSHTPSEAIDAANNAVEEYRATFK